MLTHTQRLSLCPFFFFSLSIFLCSTLDFSLLVSDFIVSFILVFYIFLFLAIDLQQASERLNFHCPLIPTPLLRSCLILVVLFYLLTYWEWVSLGGWSWGFLSWLWQRAELFNSCMGWFGIWDGQLSV